MRCSLEAPAHAVGGQIFNVGRAGENYRVREIAQIVAQEFPGCEVVAGPPSADNRSYRVSFDKIASTLPGYQAKWTAQAGAAELYRLFKRIEFGPEVYQFRAFTRLKQLMYLQRTGQVDTDLYWQPR
jgi:nucleoside-diphosphate-sugar epimerase